MRMPRLRTACTPGLGRARRIRPAFGRAGPRRVRHNLAQKSMRVTRLPAADPHVRKRSGRCRRPARTRISWSAWGRDEEGRHAPSRAGQEPANARRRHVHGRAGFHERLRLGSKNVPRHARACPVQTDGRASRLWQCSCTHVQDAGGRVPAGVSITKGAQCCRCGAS